MRSRFQSSSYVKKWKFDDDTFIKGNLKSISDRLVARKKNHFKPIEPKREHSSSLSRKTQPNSEDNDQHLFGDVEIQPNPTHKKRMSTNESRSKPRIIGRKSDCQGIKILKRNITFGERQTLTNNICPEIFAKFRPFTDPISPGINFIKTESVIILLLILLAKRLFQI